MEHRRMGLVAVHAIDAAGRDDADRRLLLQHGAHLHGRGVRAQEQPLAVRLGCEEERVVRLARGVAGREVEPREVVVVGLDVRAFGDGEAHIGEDHHQLFPNAADGMNAALGGRIGPDRERDVGAIGGELFRERCGFEPGFAGLKSSGDAFFDNIDRRAKALARFRRHRAELLQQLGDFALLAKRGNADGLQGGQIGGNLDAGQEPLHQSIEIVRLIGDGVHEHFPAANLPKRLPPFPARVKGWRAALIQGSGGGGLPGALLIGDKL